MIFSYVLNPATADKYHIKLNVHPYNEIYVGVLGHKLYTSKIESHRAFKELSSIALEPYYCVSTESDPNVDSLCEIIEGYLYNRTGKIMNIEVVRYEHCTLFYPLFNNNYIYDEHGLFLTDLSEFRNRSFLSYSELALEYQAKNRNFFGVKQQHGIITYSSECDEYIIVDEMCIRKFEATRLVETVLRTGFYSVKNDSIEATVLAELASLWKLRVKVTPDHITVMREKYYREKNTTIQAIVSTGESLLNKKPNAIDRVGFPFEDWLRESVIRIRLGKSPVMRLQGNVPQAYKLLCEQYPELKELAKIKNIGNLWQVPILGPEHVFSLLELIPQASADFTSFPKRMKRKEEVIWNLQTEDGSVQQILESKDISEELLLKNYEDGLYFTPWSRYYKRNTGLESAALFKFIYN